MTIEKTNYGSFEVYLKWLNKKQFSDLEFQNSNRKIHVSSCFCIPVKNNQILLTKNPRGWDIIGGHVEDGETLIDAMHREAKEEAGVIPIHCFLLGAIEVYNPNWTEDSPYPETSYQLFYKSDNFKMLNFNDSFECSERKFFNLKDVPDIHHNWLQTHSLILNSLN